MDGLSPLDIVETIRNPVLILDPDLRVIFANRAFRRTFQVPKNDTMGRLIYDLGDGQWNIARLRELLHGVIPTDSVVEDFEVETEFPGIGHRVMLLNARKVLRPGNHTMRLLLVFEDITDRVQRERDREQATQEIYHRVKNSLQVIMSFVAHEVRRAGADNAEVLMAIQGRIAAVAQLYDLIARSERGEAVRGDTYLAEIAVNLTASLLGRNSAIDIAVEADPLNIAKDSSVPVGLLINELTTNAIKHAFPHGRGSVRVSLRRSVDAVRLTVSDNGIGMTGAAATKGTGFGTRYVNMFVRQLDGVLSQSSNASGTSFDIRLPVSVLAD
jgi:chemotaxis protein methyltransferase CheR